MNLQSLVTNSANRDVQYYIFDCIQFAINNRQVEFEKTGENYSVIFNVLDKAFVYKKENETTFLYVVDKNGMPILFDISVNKASEIDELVKEALVKFSYIANDSSNGNFTFKEIPVTKKSLMDEIAKIENPVLREKIVYMTDKLLSQGSK